MNKSIITTDFGIQQMHKLFLSHGYELRLVGGAVRDILLNKRPKDYDFCTNATPEQMWKMATDHIKVIPTGIEHGTVTFLSLFGSFEITTLRKDINCDGRHATVQFTTDWKADAARRDFTINAMSLDASGNLYDYFNGEEDLEKGIVRFVGNAEERIKEDELRVLRYLRFITQFSKGERNTPWDQKEFDLVAQTSQDGLAKVSVERIWEEYRKVCKNSPEKVWIFLNLMYAINLHNILGFPHVLNYNTQEVSQNMLPFTAKYPEFFLAILFNDYKACERFCERYKLSNVSKENMLFMSRINHQKSIGFIQIEDMLMSGVHKDKIKAAIACHNNELKVDVDKLQYVKFPVTGKDLLEIGYEQGTELGDTLKVLRKIWKNSRYSYDRKDLLKLVPNKKKDLTLGAKCRNILSSILD